MKYVIQSILNEVFTRQYIQKAKQLDNIKIPNEKY